MFIVFCGVVIVLEICESSFLELRKIRGPYIPFKALFESNLRTYYCQIDTLFCNLSFQKIINSVSKLRQNLLIWVADKGGPKVDNKWSITYFLKQNTLVDNTWLYKFLSEHFSFENLCWFKPVKTNMNVMKWFSMKTFPQLT